MTLLKPTFSVENLIYIGYPGDPSSTIRVTRRRHVDREKQHSERNVLQCFIFGPTKAEKSTLLNSFIGRYFSGYPEVHDNTISIIEHHLIVVEFIMQATF
jgi:mitochondrial Rho GTPase 1